MSESISSVLRVLSPELRGFCRLIPPGWCCVVCLFLATVLTALTFTLRWRYHVVIVRSRCPVGLLWVDLSERWILLKVMVVERTMLGEVLKF